MGDELQPPDLKPGWGSVALKALKYTALALAAITLMMVVSGLLLVGFLVYACGHH